MTVKNIVIVGGGFAGVAIVNALEKALAKSNDKDYRIILVEKVIVKKVRLVKSN
jgi:NADH dehydrogenase FAD-containing subunit